MEMPMKQERIRQIEEIFHAACDLPSEERQAFLTRACADDDDLRREVEILLISDQEAETLVESPAFAVAAPLLVEEDSRTITGSNLGHYKITSLLGSGGMGEVYLARDSRLDRKVALKVLPEAYTLDQERLSRFRQEARAASALNHPNIVTIFEIGEIDGTHFIATEYVEGMTLRHLMNAGEIDAKLVLEIGIQASAALSEAHKVGIVHRDIKPENIMLRQDGYIKILDFGLAKLTEKFRPFTDLLNDGSLSMQKRLDTDPGRVVGTPNYMSPEQISGKGVDGRSDIFSLGILLYEMIARRPPFEGESTGEVIAAILKNDVPPLDCMADDVPRELERIISCALEKDRERRYQTISKMGDDLRNFARDLEFRTRLNRSGRAAMHEVELNEKLEPVGGAVPLNSRFYIIRPADEAFHTAIIRRDSSVLVKGARQVGKTSLLARGLQQARQAGSKVVLTDLQKLSAEEIATSESFFMALAETIADQLDLSIFPHEVWNPRRSPGVNFERYLRREVLGKFNEPIVWGLDEVDRLFTCNFGSEVFGLFRSWHNERALDPQVPWHRFTLAMAYATEAHLFITDLNQSPFNIGTRISLGDFTVEHVSELNERYGSPLKDDAEIARYYNLVGGHPFLVRSGLHEMVTEHTDLLSLESLAASNEGPFGDHLRRILIALTQDDALLNAVTELLHGIPCSDTESFFRLRSAGLVSGGSPRQSCLRCRLYAIYLKPHLL